MRVTEPNTMLGIAPSPCIRMRAVTSFAKLLNTQDRCNDARILLATLYDWFTDGFDTPDLVEARMMLEHLQ